MNKLFNWLFGKNKSTQPQIQQEPPKSYWIAKMEAEQEMDTWEDQRLIRNFKIDYEGAGERKYYSWLHSFTPFYSDLFPKGVVYVARNHREIYGDKGFYDYAHEHFLKIRDERHSKEEQKEIENRNKEEYFGPYMWDLMKKMDEEKLSE